MHCEPSFQVRPQCFGRGDPFLFEALGPLRCEQSRRCQAQQGASDGNREQDAHIPQRYTAHITTPFQ